AYLIISMDRCPSYALSLHDALPISSATGRKRIGSSSPVSWRITAGTCPRPSTPRKGCPARRQPGRATSLEQYRQAFPVEGGELAQVAARVNGAIHVLNRLLVLSSTV